MNDVRQLYLDLLKRTLSNTIYADENVAPFLPPGFDLALRSEGADWPKCAHTMIGLKRLDNLQYCVEDALARHVAGDLVETGVWRGGTVIFMRAILKAYGITDRRVWAADSFQGLPYRTPNATHRTRVIFIMGTISSRFRLKRYRRTSGATDYSMTGSGS